MAGSEQHYLAACPEHEEANVCLSTHAALAWLNKHHPLPQCGRARILAVDMNEKCKNCGLTRYAHNDHAHAVLVKQANGGMCPFGDCGHFEGEKG